MSNSASRFLNNCLNVARARLPLSCALCAAETGRGPLCAACMEDLPWLSERRCEICALPLATGRICGACLDRPPHFARVEAALAYQFPADALVRAFKYRGRLALGRVLGELLASRVDRRIDAIVPMPLAIGRLAERGYNQALEIARIVAVGTGVPLFPDCCRKVTDTPPQASLPWKERARNVRRAFVCDRDLQGMRVAVVDDVLTTGASLNELARVLRKAGAVEVQGWVATRTLPG